jgi:hypothetical protein
MAERSHLLAGIAVAVASLWLGYESYVWLRPTPKFDEARRIREVMDADPVAGSTVDGLSLPGGRVVVAWIGECRSCSKSPFEFDRWKSAVEEGTTFLLLSDEGSAEGFPSEWDVHVAPRKSIDRLNPYFSPRFYLFVDGRLERAQLMGEDPVLLMTRLDRG